MSYHWEIENPKLTGIVEAFTPYELPNFQCPCGDSIDTTPYPQVARIVCSCGRIYRLYKDTEPIAMFMVVSPPTREI